MSEAENLLRDAHVRRYRETGGEVGHIWRRGAKTLLLTTKGRKTGNPTTAPLIYEQHGENYVVVASQGGAPRLPGWYRNLAARARTATGDERERSWRLAAQQWPDYDAYQRRTGREVAVVVLERTG